MIAPGDLLSSKPAAVSSAQAAAFPLPARRRERLEAMQRQVKDGSLTIRKMTPEERKRNPARPSMRPGK
jgi:hypothetical protein